LRSKNEKNTAKIYAIPRGKGMLPLSEIRQYFLTTPHGILAPSDTGGLLMTSVKLLYCWGLLTGDRWVC
jgi:hypothetical protein